MKTLTSIMIATDFDDYCAIEKLDKNSIAAIAHKAQFERHHKGVRERTLKRMGRR